VHSTGGKSNPSKLHLLAGGVAPDAAAAAAPAPSFWILPPRLLLTKLNLICFARRTHGTQGAKSITAQFHPPSRPS